MGWQEHVTLKVRFGFGSGPLAVSPSFTDVAASTFEDVRDVIISRGRGSVHETFDAGVADITLDNRVGRYDPNNTGSTFDPNLKLGTPVSIQGVHSGTTDDLFYGHISRWSLDYPDVASDAVAHIEVTENSAVLRTTLIQASTFAEESSDTRIGNILDDVSWPAGARSLETGAADTAAGTFTGESQDLIDQTVEAEQGQFFIAKNGDATLLNRITFSGTTSQAIFGPTSTDFDYTEIAPVYDDDELINLAEITGSTGDAVTASDSTSITNHGEHSFQTSNSSIIGEPGALNVAETLVIRNRDIVTRVTEFTIEPQQSTALWPEILGRELQDVITVKVDPPGTGTTLDQDVAVESIQHEIVGGHWRTTYGCHPLTTFELSTDIWILGTSTDLDTDTVLV
jgi:hypothetical protein